MLGESVEEALDRGLCRLGMVWGGDHESGWVAKGLDRTEQTEGARTAGSRREHCDGGEGGEQTCNGGSCRCQQSWRIPIPASDFSFPTHTSQAVVDLLLLFSIHAYIHI